MYKVLINAIQKLNEASFRFNAHAGHITLNISQDGFIWESQYFCNYVFIQQQDMMSTLAIKQPKLNQLLYEMQ